MNKQGFIDRKNVTPTMHLRQSEIIYSVFGPFTKTKKVKKEYNFKETGDPTYIYQDELDKACF